MNTQEAIGILEDYVAWSKGDDNKPVPNPILQFQATVLLLAEVKNSRLDGVSGFKYPAIEEVEERAESEINKLDCLDYTALEKLFIKAVKWVKQWQTDNH